MATWDLVKKEALAWSRATDALSTADAAAQAANLPLLLPAGQHVIDTNLTIDSPVWFTPGSIIKPDDGATVTLAGGVVNAPMSQIFDHSAGGVVAPQNVTVYPEWWGALGDDSNDDGPALVAMFQDSPAAGGSANIVLPEGKTYATSEAFEVQSHSYITGHGTIKCTQDTPGGRGAVVLMVNGVQDIIWDGPTVDGNLTTNANPIAIGTGIGFDPEDPYNEDIIVRATVKNARIDPLDETVGWVIGGGGKGFSIQGRTRNIRADIIAENCDFGATIEAGTTDGRDVGTTVLNLISKDSRRTALVLMGSTPAGYGSAVSASAPHGRFPGVDVNLIAMGGNTEDIIDPSDDVTEYPNNHYFGVVTCVGAVGAKVNAHCSVEANATLLRGNIFASEINIHAYMDDLQNAWDARAIEDTGATFVNQMDNTVDIKVHAAEHSATLIKLDTDTDVIRRSSINVDVWCEDGVGPIVNSAGSADFGESVFYRFRDMKTLAEVSGNSTIESLPTWAMAPSAAGRVALQAYSVIGDGDATPSVSNGAASLTRTANSSPTTITNLDNGRPGQVVAIRFGDSNTTVAHGGSTTIRLQDATNHTFASAETLTLVFDGTGWVEVSRSSTIAASAYTPTNVSTDRAFDADTVAVAELADVVGTLIADLQARRIIG